MELWIRNQDKRYLIKTEYLYAVYSEEEKKAYIGDKLAGHIGEYKTLERALEILDEIMLQMRNTLILSISPLMTAQDQHRLLDIYKKEFNRDFILETSTVEIKPLNSEIVLYELPKE